METRRTWFQRNKGVSIILSILIIIIIALFAWSQVERRNYNKRINEQRVEIIDNSRKLIDENRRKLLYDLTRSLSWAVLSEVSRNNYDQANQYLNEFVRTREFEVAIFADNEDRIVMATDKKMEQSGLNDHFPGDVSNVQEINIQIWADNKWMTVAPVMSLNSRIGTLVLVYDPGSISDDAFLSNQNQ